MCTANLIGFDVRSATKGGLLIVTASTITEVNGKPFLLRVHEAVYNAGSPTTLLSEYQLHDYGCLVDSVSTKHRTHDNPIEYGHQSFIPTPNFESSTALTLWPTNTLNPITRNKILQKCARLNGSKCTHKRS